MKTGLVMEGGAMRGLYTCGIMDVFMENGITFDGAIGVSAGGTFGCNYGSWQPGRALRYNLKYAHDPRYCSVAALLLTGDLYPVKFDYDLLPKRLDIFDTFTFRTNPMRFYIVVTDCESGAPVYHELKRMDEEDLTWLRASASMPVAAQIVRIDGRGYLDGGCSDAIPLKHFQTMGYEKNIVILTQPDGYRKQPQKGLTFMRPFLRQAPGVYEDLKHRHIAYNETLDYVAEQEKGRNTLVFRPREPLPIQHVSHSRKDLQSVYDLGRKEAEERLEEVKQFLA